MREDFIPNPDENLEEERQRQATGPPVPPLCLDLPTSPASQPFAATALYDVARLYMVEQDKGPIRTFSQSHLPTYGLLLTHSLAQPPLHTRQNV